MSRSLVLALLGATLLIGTGCRDKGTPEKEGERFFQKACARCHGESGEGGFVPEGATVKSRDLTSAGWQSTVTDEELRQVIRDGRGQMSGFGQVFSLDQIDTIVKYIRTLRKADPKGTSPMTDPNTEGAAPEPAAPPSKPRSGY